MSRTKRFSPEELEAIVQNMVAMDIADLSPEKQAALNDLPEVKEVLEDASLSTDERVTRLRPIVARMGPELEASIAEHERNVAHLRGQLDALERIKPWGARTDLQLEKNDCSRLHKLVEAAALGRVVVGKDDEAVASQQLMLYFKNAHVFVVEHDWAKAFEGATDYHEGEFALPFEHCAFEFRIGGRTVVVIVFQPTPETRSRLEKPIDDPQIAVPFVDCGGGWWWCAGAQAQEQPVMQYAWLQIRAIAIALDAEVATREVVRAPVALNEKREKKGEVPLYDFHVVKLRGRMKHGRAAAGGTHRSPRLHFRRGHWRHYETHRTWIRWMLVGDPDLGHIDKSYRL